jgi:hypothetical protein
LIETGPHLASLRAYVEARDFAGYDPYDALNSPVARALGGEFKWGRIAWIQALRRCPVNFRPLLLVRPGHNPKGLGLFLGGYARLFKLGNGEMVQPHVDRLFGLLSAARSPGYSGNCWGYNFDWQSRAFYVRRGTPTVVNSGFIGHALLDAWEATGEGRFLDLAASIPGFLLKDLKRTAEGDSFCFSYTPVDTTAVHNANLLGASLLVRLAGATGDPSLVDPALASLRYTMRHQREDGSWTYAEAKAQRWIDSFHTGFNLGALRHFFRAGKALEYREAFRRGVEYYAATFFLDDGTPKYYHDRVYPIDIHAPAEAVAFFSGEGPQWEPLLERVLTWMLSKMRDPSGCFYFRRFPRGVNRIPYMRWAQAWAFAALCEYAATRAPEAVP